MVPRHYPRTLLFLGNACVPGSFSNAVLSRLVKSNTTVHNTVNLLWFAVIPVVFHLPAAALAYAATNNYLTLHYTRAYVCWTRACWHRACRLWPRTQPRQHRYRASCITSTTRCLPAVAVAHSSPSPQLPTTSLPTPLGRATRSPLYAARLVTTT